MSSTSVWKASSQADDCNGLSVPFPLVTGAEMRYRESMVLNWQPLLFVRIPVTEVPNRVAIVLSANRGVVVLIGGPATQSYCSFDNC